MISTSRSTHPLPPEIGIMDGPSTTPRSLHHRALIGRPAVLPTVSSTTMRGVTLLQPHKARRQPVVGYGLAGMDTHGTGLPAYVGEKEFDCARLRCEPPPAE